MPKGYLYDRIGLRVPDAVKPAMVHRDKLLKQCDHLDVVFRRIENLANISPYGAQVDVAAVGRAVMMATEEVKDGIPDYLCTEADETGHHPTGCQRCGGKRWLSRREHEMQYSGPTVYLHGEIVKQAVLVDVPARKTKIARPIVKSGDEEYELIAEGKAAEHAANLTNGTPVMVAGQLVKRKWKTGDGEEHEQFVIVVERMT